MVHTSASPLAVPGIGLWALQTARAGNSSHNLTDRTRLTAMQQLIPYFRAP